MGGQGHLESVGRQGLDADGLYHASEGREFRPLVCATLVATFSENNGFGHAGYMHMYLHVHVRQLGQVCCHNSVVNFF